MLWVSRCELLGRSGRAPCCCRSRARSPSPGSSRCADPAPARWPLCAPVRLTVASSTDCTFCWIERSIVSWTSRPCWARRSVTVLSGTPPGPRTSSFSPGWPPSTLLYSCSMPAPSVPLLFEVDVADQLRGQLAGRVVAAHGVDREQPRRVRRHDLGGDGGVELRQHPRLHHVRRRQPALQQLHLGPERLLVLELVAQLLGDVGGDLAGVLHLGRVDHQVLRGHVDGQRLAGRVEDPAAAGGHHDGRVLLAVGAGGEGAGLQDLHVQRAPDHDREGGCEHEHDQPQPLVGLLAHGAALPPCWPAGSPALVAGGRRRVLQRVQTQVVVAQRLRRDHAVAGRVGVDAARARSLRRRASAARRSASAAPPPGPRSCWPRSSCEARPRSAPRCRPTGRRSGAPTAHPGRRASAPRAAAPAWPAGARFCLRLGAVSVAGAARRGRDGAAGAGATTLTPASFRPRAAWPTRSAG